MLNLNIIINRHPARCGNYLNATLYFSGDTFPQKNNIKSLGYSYKSSSYSSVWEKEVPLVYLKDEIVKAQTIGAEITVYPEFTSNAANLWRACKIMRETDVKTNMSTSTVLENYRIPAILEGKCWNGVVYGNIGHYFIYLDDMKISISDAQAEEIETYKKHRKSSHARQIRVEQDNAWSKLLPYIINLLKNDFLKSKRANYGDDDEWLKRILDEYK